MEIIQLYTLYNDAAICKNHFRTMNIFKRPGVAGAILQTPL